MLAANTREGASVRSLGSQLRWASTCVRTTTSGTTSTGVTTSRRGSSYGISFLGPSGRGALSAPPELARSLEDISSAHWRCPALQRATAPTQLQAPRPVNPLYFRSPSHASADDHGSAAYPPEPRREAADPDGYCQHPRQPTRQPTRYSRGHTARVRPSRSARSRVGCAGCAAPSRSPDPAGSGPRRPLARPPRFTR